MRALALACLFLSLLGAGCRGEPKNVGEPCSDNDECARGLCVQGAGGGDEALCTRSCASSDECPNGWTCSGATQDNVLICRRGDATPFGQ
jgi:hypothetical protein